MDLVNQVSGFFVTLRQFFKPPITVEYPDAMRELSPRFRGAVGCCLTLRRGARSAWAAASARRSAPWTASASA